VYPMSVEVPFGSNCLLDSEVPGRAFFLDLGLLLMLLLGRIVIKFRGARTDGDGGEVDSRDPVVTGTGGSPLVGGNAGGQCRV